MGFSVSPIQKRALLVLVLLLAVAGVWDLLPGTRLRAKQAELIEWAGGGSLGDFRDSIAAPGYRDQWHESVNEVLERVRAARFAFPGLTVEAGEPAFTREGDSALVRQTITIRGADEVREAQFIFRWRRQNWLPWSWRLESSEAPGLEF